MTGAQDSSGAPLPPPPPDAEPVAIPVYTGSAGAGTIAEAPPRPRVWSGVLLMLVGSALSLLGAFLPWWDDGAGFTRSGSDVLFGRSGTGYRQIHGPGHVVIALAVLLALLAVLMLVAGRVLSAAIVGIIASGVAFFYSLACLSIVQDTRAVVGGGTISFGVPTAIVGASASLVGSVLATAKRRYTND